MSVFFYPVDSKLSELEDRIVHIISKEEDSFQKTVICDNKQLLKGLRQRFRENKTLLPQLCSSMSFIRIRSEFMDPRPMLCNKQQLDLCVDNYLNVPHAYKERTLLSTIPLTVSLGFLEKRGIPQQDLELIKGFYSFIESKGYCLPFESLNSISFYDNESIIYIPSYELETEFPYWFKEQLQNKDGLSVILPETHHSCNPVAFDCYQELLELFAYEAQFSLNSSERPQSQFSGKGVSSRYSELDCVLKELYRGNCEANLPNENQIFFYYAHGIEPYAKSVSEFLSHLKNVRKEKGIAPLLDKSDTDGDLMDENKREGRVLSIKIVTAFPMVADKIRAELKKDGYRVHNTLENISYKSSLYKLLWAILKIIEEGDYASYLDYLNAYPGAYERGEGLTSLYSLIHSYQGVVKPDVTYLLECIRELAPGPLQLIERIEEIFSSDVSRETLKDFEAVLRELSEGLAKDKRLYKIDLKVYERILKQFSYITNGMENKGICLDIQVYSELLESLKLLERCDREDDGVTQIDIVTPHQARTMQTDISVVLDMDRGGMRSFKVPDAFQHYLKKYQLPKKVDFYLSQRKAFYDLVASTDKYLALVKLQLDRSGGELQSSQFLNEVLDLYASDETAKEIPQQLLEYTDPSTGVSTKRHDYVHHLYGDPLTENTPVLSADRRKLRMKVREA